MKKTIVVNILGGPGVGKTTVASELFVILKKKGYDVENVSEFAKELVWEERNSAFNDRLYMHAEQNHRLLQMNGKLDYIICDSPLILTSVYNRFYLSNVHTEEYNKMIDDVVLQTFNLYDNKVFLLNREIGYVENGRRENEEEAIAIDNHIHNYLINNNIFYQTLKSRESAVNEILAALQIDN